MDGQESLRLAGSFADASPVNSSISQASALAFS